jgi:hypothetical protein
LIVSKEECTPKFHDVVPTAPGLVYANEAPIIQTSPLDTLSAMLVTSTLAGWICELVSLQHSCVVTRRSMEWHRDVLEQKRKQSDRGESSETPGRKKEQKRNACLEQTKDDQNGTRTHASFETRKNVKITLT